MTFYTVAIRDKTCDWTAPECDVPLAIEEAACVVANSASLWDASSLECRIVQVDLDEGTARDVTEDALRWYASTHDDLPMWLGDYADDDHPAKVEVEREREADRSADAYMEH